MLYWITWLAGLSDFEWLMFWAGVLLLILAVTISLNRID